MLENNEKRASEDETKNGSKEVNSNRIPQPRRCMIHAGILRDRRYHVGKS